MERAASRAVRAVGVVATLGLLAGCGTICDEVADEAEASGCAVGGDETSDTAPPEVECKGEVEKRAQCLQDNSENVCSITDEEAEKITQCIGE